MKLLIWVYKSQHITFRLYGVRWSGWAWQSSIVEDDLFQALDAIVLRRKQAVGGERSFPTEIIVISLHMTALELE